MLKSVLGDIPILLIGKGLLGKSIGEVAEINVPNGVLKFEILEISRD